MDAFSHCLIGNCSHEDILNFNNSRVLQILNLSVNDLQKCAYVWSITPSNYSSLYPILKCCSSKTILPPTQPPTVTSCIMIGLQEGVYPWNRLEAGIYFWLDILVIYICVWSVLLLLCLLHIHYASCTMLTFFMHYFSWSLQVYMRWVLLWSHLRKV